MIKNILDLLAIANGETENIRIAQGKFALPTTFKQIRTIIAINLKSTLSCINLFEYFLLVFPPLKRVPIPRSKTTATIIKSIMPKIFTKVPEIIILL
jgi:hypothetical protein